MKKPSLITSLLAITDKDMLAKIWVDLNRREWPAALPKSKKPFWWSKPLPSMLQNVNSSERKYALSITLMEFIEEQVGKRKCLKEWRVYCDGKKTKTK